MNKILGRDDQQCSHKHPDTILIADLVNREGKPIRSYFCLKCNGYKDKDIDHEEGDHQFFLKIKEQQYLVHCPPGTLPPDDSFWKKYI